MGTSFLPRTDAALLAWANNFLAVAQAAPATYGLTAAQCTDFGTLVTAYAAALAACDPGIRNKAATVTKKQARVDLEQSARLLAMLVQAQASVTDAQKIKLGLNVRAMPTRRPVPDTEPGLRVVSVFGQTVKIRLFDKMAGRRGKPPGVIGASVFTYVGPVAPQNIAEWAFRGNWGTTSIDVAFASDLPPGTLVWFTACWFNGRKQSGPACAPVYTHLAGGGVALGTMLLAA